MKIYTILSIVFLFSGISLKGQSWIDQIQSSLDKEGVTILFSDSFKDQKLFDAINSYRAFSFYKNALHFDTTGLYTSSRIAINQLLDSNNVNINKVALLSGPDFSAGTDYQQIYHVQSDSMFINKNDITKELIDHIYEENTEASLVDWTRNFNQNEVLIYSGSNAVVSSKVVLEFQPSGQLIKLKWKHVSTFVVYDAHINLARATEDSGSFLYGFD